MKTIVRLVRGTSETKYEPLDLPYVPEGARVHTPHMPSCRVLMCAIDISPADGPVQTLVVG